MQNFGFAEMHVVTINLTAVLGEDGGERGLSMEDGDT